MKEHFQLKQLMSGQGRCLSKMFGQDIQLSKLQLINAPMDQHKVMTTKTDQTHGRQFDKRTIRIDATHDYATIVLEQTVQSRYSLVKTVTPQRMHGSTQGHDN